MTYLPSLPTNGESFTLNIIVSVGGSISVASSGCGLSGSQMLSLMSTDFQADQRDDVAGGGVLDVLAAEAVEHLHLLHLALDLRAVALDDRSPAGRS